MHSSSSSGSSKCYSLSVCERSLYMKDWRRYRFHSLHPSLTARGRERKETIRRKPCGRETNNHTLSRAHRSPFSPADNSIHGKNFLFFFSSSISYFFDGAKCDKNNHKEGEAEREGRVGLLIFLFFFFFASSSFLLTNFIVISPGSSSYRPSGYTKYTA